MRNNEGDVVYRLALTDRRFLESMIDGFAGGAVVFELVVINDLNNLFWTQELPETHSGYHKESVVLEDIMDTNFRFRNNTNLMRNQVTDCSGNWQSWIHSSSNINSRLSI